jgi:hypothetical protein
VSAESTCLACNVARNVIGVIPTAGGYEIRTFQCPECKSILKLVVRDEPAPAPERANPAVSRPS